MLKLKYGELPTLIQFSNAWDRMIQINGRFFKYKKDGLEYWKFDLYEALFDKKIDWIWKECALKELEIEWV